MKALLETAPRILEEPALMRLWPAHQQVWQESLGWGEMYYALTRSLKPEHIVVIGSGRGFVPIMFGLACVDNRFGHVHFVDPGYVDTFWHDPKWVREWFNHFGVADVITHYKVESEPWMSLGHVSKVGIAFVDGDHTYEGVKRDHALLRHMLVCNALVMFHDSLHVCPPVYQDDDWAGVWKYVHELEQVLACKMFTFPQDPGLTLFWEDYGPDPKPSVDVWEQSFCTKKEWQWAWYKSPREECLGECKCNYPGT